MNRELESKAKKAEAALRLKNPSSRISTVRSNASPQAQTAIQESASHKKRDR